MLGCVITDAFKFLVPIVTALSCQRKLRGLVFCFNCFRSHNYNDRCTKEMLKCNLSVLFLNFGSSFNLDVLGKNLKYRIYEEQRVGLVIARLSEDVADVS